MGLATASAMSFSMDGGLWMKRMREEMGMTLVEVLVALLILALGLLGAGAVQLKALRYTESARMNTQAAFIAAGMLERIRASADQASPGEEVLGNVLARDLAEFASDVASFGGADAKGDVSTAQGLYTVHIAWDDSRASGSSEQLRSLELGSRLVVRPGGVR